MTLFSCTAISKSFNDVNLFERISLGMESGERVGIIGTNGAGKTTILQIVAGAEEPDEGSVAWNKDATFEYLSQNTALDGNRTVLQTAMDARPFLHELLQEHAALCALTSMTEQEHRRMESVSAEIDNLRGWNLESEAKIFLQRLGVARFDDLIKHLSGGLRKRVALAKTLLSEADLLILDEPTNHLDADSVQWLQDYLQNSPRGLLLITHDRYFLDAVTTRIIELERRRIISYAGNYEEYLERKEAMIANEEATAEHRRNRLRTELAWLQKGAKARRTKQKSRIDWVQKLREEQANLREALELKSIKIEVGNQFAGSQLIDAVNISKSIGGRALFENFTYKAAAGERIGIIGSNGSGKSTLLNILVGEIPPDTGTVKIGVTARIGYFRQESTDINPGISVMAAVREIAEYIDTGIGRDRYLSAKDMLERFNFANRQFHTLVGNLSGGERRRLGLLRVLMANPNILILDEPTNDFDIPTLSALEEYLQNFYGALIVVSHDRAFLDRTVEFIYAFETSVDGRTIIKQYPGNYTAYLEKKELKSEQAKEQAKEQPREELKNLAEDSLPNTKADRKNAYQLRREKEQLERTIADLERKKAQLEEFLSTGAETDYRILQTRSDELTAIHQNLDAAIERWMTVSEELI